MKKQEAGYSLLMILTNVDHKLNVAEDMVVRKWLEENFDKKGDLDHCMQKISALPETDYPVYFQKQMEVFYSDSTAADRLRLLHFAMDLIKADGKITKEENTFFDLLYNAWSGDNIE
ncbi:MAG: TerB family tellurite resistance protein [Niastella sp.]|nr:TerB family tellurite resistance protein [Niastella sp.]